MAAVKYMWQYVVHSAVLCSSVTVGDSGRHAMALRMGTVGIWWRTREVETILVCNETGEVEK